MTAYTTTQRTQDRLRPVVKPAGKRLSAIFNLAVGAGAAAAAKALFGVCAVSFGAPALLLAIGAGMAGGLASSFAVHAVENYSRRRNGEETIAYTGKKALKAAFFGALGGGAFSLFDLFFGSASPSCAPSASAPLVVAPPAPLADITPTLPEITPDPVVAETPVAKPIAPRMVEPSDYYPDSEIRMTVEPIPAAPDSIIMRDGNVFTADYNGPHETMESIVPAPEPVALELIELEPGAPVTEVVVTADAPAEPAALEPAIEPATEPESLPDEDSLGAGEELVVENRVFIAPNCQAIIGQDITFVCEVDKSDPLFRIGNRIDMVGPPVMTMMLK